MRKSHGRSRLIMAIICIYVCMNASCSKEHSCESCQFGNVLPPTDTTVVADTTPIDSTLEFPNCNLCDSSVPLRLNSWSYKNYKSFVCGDIIKSYISPGTNSVAFWGDLSCSSNTGFNLAFASPQVLDADHYNIPTRDLALYIQDRNNYLDAWNGRILWSDPNKPTDLTIVIDTFTIATKLVVGRFYGFANARDKKSYIDGKFKFIIP